MPVSAKEKRPRKGDLYDPMCPSRAVLERVTSKWGVLILILLRERTHRFSELGRRVGGVSQKMLAQTLQALEGDGFVLRKVHPTVPPQVEYSLTPMGAEVAVQVEALKTWIEANLGQVMKVRRATAARAQAPAAATPGRGEEARHA